MADNVAITAGAGTTVATDQAAGGEHYQKVKLVDGTADSTTVIPGGANGLKVDLTSTGANATAIKVDGSAATQPVSGTVTVQDGGGSITVDGSVTVDSELTTADLDTGAGTDTRAVVGLVGAKSGGGVLIPGDATKGLAVDLTATGANSTAIKVDGSAVTQPVRVGAGTTRVQVASSGLTTSVTAYSAGDVLGAELTFASAAQSASTFTILSATLVDYAKVVGAVDLFLFDQSGVTHAADNAANSWSDADMIKCIGIISFPPPILSANNSIAVVPYVGLAGKLAAGTSLYGLLVTRAGHTFFGAATDLTTTLLISQD